MEIILCILVFYIVLIFTMLIRNEIVYRCREKAREIVYTKAVEDIETNKDWEKRFKNFESYGSYNRMMFSFTKWRFEDFYPGIEE